MKRVGPRSVLQLLLAGFLVVAVPLIAALVVALVQVGDLSRQSRFAVFQAAQAMQSSRGLVQRIVDMQRNAQQYQVLGDRSLYQAYQAKRQEFLSSIRQLARLHLGGSLRQMLGELVSREQALHDHLEKLPPGPDYASAAGSGFPALVDLARSIMIESSRLIGNEADRMQRAADRTQRTLLWLAAAFIPGTLILAALFTWLITRPLKQVDGAIRRLGTGEFGTPVAVQGPRDLEELGRRLDWLRKRLAELEAQKVNFLRQVSHELKTPLSAIREGAGLLTDEVAGTLNAEQSEIVRILSENSIRLQKLIEDLLKFSVSRPPDVRVDGRPIALDGVLHRVMEDHKLSTASRNLEVRADLEQVEIFGDPEQLRVILDNLMSNAVKYSPPDGTIHIGLSRYEGRAVIDIRDEGPGVDREERGRVFEAFYQGSTTSAGPVKGTGLGLAIAREYAHMHQGDIDLLDSERGAHFRVSLPLAPAYAAGASATGAGIDAPA